MTTQAPKTLFWAKKWLFLAKKCVFLVVAALKPLIVCSTKPCKTLFFEPSTLKIGYGALQLTTPGVSGYKMAFLAIFGQKMRFFLVMAAPKHSITCSKNLALHVFLSPPHSKKVMGPYN